MKCVRAKKYRQALHDRISAAAAETEDTTASYPATPASSVTGTGRKSATKGALDDEDSGQDSEDDGGVAEDANGGDADEDENLTAEEIGERVEGLVRQQNTFRDKVFEASHSLRAFSFGQDRYKRRYWALPHLGGIFVEGSELGGDMPSPPKRKKVKQEDVKEEIKSEIKSELKTENAKSNQTESKPEMQEVKAEADPDIKPVLVNGSHELVDKVDNSEKCNGDINVKSQDDLISGNSQLPNTVSQLSNTDSSQAIMNGLDHQECVNKSSDMVTTSSDAVAMSSDVVTTSSCSVTMSSADKISTSLVTSSDTITTSSVNSVTTSSSSLNNTSSAVASSIKSSSATMCSIDSILGNSTATSTNTSVSTVSTTASSDTIVNASTGLSILSSSTAITSNSVINSSIVNTAELTWFSIVPKIPCDEQSACSMAGGYNGYLDALKGMGPGNHALQEDDFIQRDVQPIPDGEAVSVNL